MYIIYTCYIVYKCTCPLLQVMYTDRALVTSAPTGSGKTVIFELAIIRLLMQTAEQMSSTKIVYGEPINTAHYLLY